MGRPVLLRRVSWAVTPGGWPGGTTVAPSSQGGALAIPQAWCPFPTQVGFYLQGPGCRRGTSKDPLGSQGKVFWPWLGRSSSDPRTLPAPVPALLCSQALLTSRLHATSRDLSWQQPELTVSSSRRPERDAESEPQPSPISVRSGGWGLAPWSHSTCTCGPSQPLSSFSHANTGE